MNKFNFNKLTPFKWFVLENFPFIEADFDALTEWQLFCKLGKEMNKIINSENTLGTQMENVTNAFIELQNYVNNYFDNLDVQDEINNKLNEMVEDGTLQNLLLDYVSVSKIYNTHQEMIEDLTIVNNQKVRTLGYHEINDGGGAIYYITNNNNLIGYKEELNNSLFALLCENEVYPEMFGAYGDNIHNDQIAFETLINNFDKMNLNKKTYKVTSLRFTKNFLINGNDATIIDDSNVTNLIEMTTASQNKILKIYDLYVNAQHSNVGIYINNNRLIGRNINVSNALLIDIHIVKSGSYGSCQIDYVRCNNSQVGIQLNASDCFISHYVGFNCMKHLINRGGITHLNSFHGWNFNSESKDWITGSTLIDTTASIIGNDIYVDTLENGIILPDGGQYTSIILQNVSYFLNTSSYPKTQQHPTLLKNIENYNGYCRIDGLFADENGWSDNDGNYPVLIDNIYLSKISLTNVTNSGFRFGRFKPIETNEDIQVSSYDLDVDTYVTYNTRKVKYKNYDMHIYMAGSMRTSCPNNTIISQLTFKGQQLQNLNLKSRVKAKFVSSSNPGVVYDLPAYINNSHQLSIYNNTGISLGSAGNYGSLIVYIDDYNQN